MTTEIVTMQRLSEREKSEVTLCLSIQPEIPCWMLKCWKSRKKWLKGENIMLVVRMNTQGSCLKEINSGSLISNLIS